MDRGLHEVSVTLTEDDALDAARERDSPLAHERPLPVPPNGQSFHAAVNSGKAINSGEDIQTWFRFSRLRPDDPRPDCIVGPQNPMIRYALQRSTVPEPLR